MATLFYRTHELKYRGFHLYFSPLVWFATFYGQYESMDGGWHTQYLVVTPPPNGSWEIANIPLFILPAQDKPSHRLPELKDWEDTILHDLCLEYPDDHTMLRPLIESDEALCFFGLKPGTPWTPAMGNSLI